MLSIKRRIMPVIMLSSVLACMNPLNVAASVDWDKVKGKDVVLFYPGQASWEWILSDHSAAKTVRHGGNCRECHETEEKDMGKKIASGKKLEPNPIKGKPGSLPIHVKFANDGDKLYVQLTWKDTQFHSGKKMDSKYPLKVAMMIGSKQVKESTIAGCWGACHDDATDMASATPKKERTLYLTASRTKLTRHGGGDDYKSSADLKKLLSAGDFMEYWQAKLIANKPAVAVDGYILDKRNKSKKPELKNGKWTVTMSRKLKVNGDGRREFSPDETYYIGFAIHDDYTEGRFHYVSFGHTLAIGEGDTDFVATKQ